MLVVIRSLMKDNSMVNIRNFANLLTFIGLRLLRNEVEISDYLCVR